MRQVPFKTQIAVICLILAIVGAMFAYIAHLPQDDGTHRRGEIARMAEAPVTAIATPVFVPAPRGAEVVTSRFKAEPEFVADAEEATEGWTSGLVNGKQVWQDNQSGMIWGPRLDMALANFTDGDFKKAKEACASQTPEGVWALPTAAEFDIAKVNGILKADSGARHRWVSYQNFGTIELPSGRGYVAVSVEKEFSVRCVARSAKAPVDGYAETTNEITLKAMSE